MRVMSGSVNGLECYSLAQGRLVLFTTIIGRMKTKEAKVDKPNPSIIIYRTGLSWVDI